MAEIVAEMVQDGDHIFLDASTTAVFIAKALKDKERLTVITNHGNPDRAFGRIRMEYHFHRRCHERRISCVSGIQDRGSHPFLLCGQGVFFPVRHLIRNGESWNPGVFWHNEKAMIASGRKKSLVVDSTKFDQTAFSVAGKLRDLDVVVTDKKAV